MSRRTSIDRVPFRVPASTRFDPVIPVRDAGTMNAITHLIKAVAESQPEIIAHGN